MSYKPSQEEQKWAKILDHDRQKQRKIRIKDLNTHIIPDSTNIICPNDSITMETVDIDSTGIIIHKCPYCGGVWLDRLNLEKLFYSSKQAEKFLVYLAKILNIKITEI